MTNVGGTAQGQLNWPYSAYVIGDYTGQTVPQGMSSDPRAPRSSTSRYRTAQGASSSSGLNFSPDNVTVVIGVNNTVMWTNDDVALHTVTSSSVPAGAQSFNDCEPESGFHLHRDVHRARDIPVPLQHPFVDARDHSRKVIVKPDAASRSSAAQAR